jgi:hypothetical protein
VFSTLLLLETKFGLLLLSCSYKGWLTGCSNDFSPAPKLGFELLFLNPALMGIDPFCGKII